MRWLRPPCRSLSWCGSTWLRSLRARLCDVRDMRGAELEATLHRLRADLRQMALWADNCPENCAHLRLIMEAELARLEGRMPEALALYERAISSARSNEYRRDEAQGNELAGRYMLTLGLAKAAEGYLRAAHYIYYRWGAHRKVQQMEQEYPQLLQATSPVTGRRQPTTDIARLRLARWIHPPST
jgi:hypothetical protein